MALHNNQYWITVALLLLLGGSLPAAEAMTEFSAEVDYFDRQGGAVMKGKIFVSDDVIREEIQFKGQTSIRITDLFRGTTSLLDTVHREYQQREETFTVPRDPALFCAEMPLMVCGYQGTEPVNGVNTERWGAELGLGSLSVEVVAWYDPRIQYPLRIELGNGRQLKLSNVQQGRIPSVLLAIPFDYQRVESIEGGEGDHFSGWP